MMSKSSKGRAPAGEVAEPAEGSATEPAELAAVTPASAPNPVEAGDGAWVTGWGRASKVAGVPATALRRMHDRGELHAEKGADGAWRFRNADLHQLASVRAPAVPPASAPRSSDDGGLAADVFEMFAHGDSPDIVVIATRRPPAVIAQLHDAWVRMSGAVVLPASVREVFEGETGARLSESKELVQLFLALLLERRELRGFTYPCTHCRQPVQASTNEWRALVAGGYLHGWCHGGCLGGDEGE